MKLIGEVVPLMNASGNLQWNKNYPNAGVFEKDMARAHLWVAEYKGQLAGVAAITDRLTPEYAQTGVGISRPVIVIHRLAVAPAFRGRGIAEAFLAKSEEIAVEQEIKQVWIDTNRENLIARNLFLKAGYLFGGEITYTSKPGLIFAAYYRQMVPKGN